VAAWLQGSPGASARLQPRATPARLREFPFGENRSACQFYQKRHPGIQQPDACGPFPGRSSIAQCHLLATISRPPRPKP